jgi:hypothetical protein
MSDFQSFRPVDEDFYNGLQLESDKIYPLPGAIGRPVHDDSRVKDSAKMDQVCYYEHVATIQHVPTKMFFVSFRETMQAMLARQRDLKLYPKWLIDTQEKQNERLIFIYLVTKHWKTVGVLKSHEDWLTDFNNPTIFDALSRFLVKKGVLDANFLCKKGI